MLKLRQAGRYPPPPPHDPAPFPGSDALPRWERWMVLVGNVFAIVPLSAAPQSLQEAADNRVSTGQGTAVGALRSMFYTTFTEFYFISGSVFPQVLPPTHTHAHATFVALSFRSDIWVSLNPCATHSQSVCRTTHKRSKCLKTCLTLPLHMAHTQGLNTTTLICGNPSFWSRGLRSVYPPVLGTKNGLSWERATAAAFDLFVPQQIPVRCQIAFCLWFGFSLVAHAVSRRSAAIIRPCSFVTPACRVGPCVPLRSCPRCSPRRALLQPDRK